MALRTLRVGSLENIHQYDDAEYDSALETDQPIKAGTPVDSNDVVRLSDIGDSATGPASSTDNAIVRFDGTSGKLLQNSLVLIDDSGNILVANGALIGLGVSSERMLFGSNLIKGLGSYGAQNDLLGGTAVSAQATGAGDTFVLTVSTTAGAVVALEVNLIGKYTNHSEGFYKKFYIYAGVGTGYVYDPSTLEHVSIGDALRSNLTAGIPVTVASQAQFTVTFTNAHSVAFTGHITIRSFSSLSTTYTIANNQ